MVSMKVTAAAVLVGIMMILEGCAAGSKVDQKNAGKILNNSSLGRQSAAWFAVTQPSGGLSPYTILLKQNVYVAGGGA